MVEVVCETDFVARNREFKELAHDLAMQVAAVCPYWVKPEDVPQEVLEKEREIAKEGLPKDKPAQVIEKIIEGKIKKFYAQTCLLEQTFIKDEKLTIRELVKEKVAKLGENIQVRRFVRFQI